MRGCRAEGSSHRIESWQQLHTANEDAGNGCPADQRRTRNGRTIRQAVDEKPSQRHAVQPDSLRKSQQELRSEYQSYARERNGSAARIGARHQHVGGIQQPRNVGGDRDQIQVVEVEQLKSTEREQQRAGRSGVAAKGKVTKKEKHPAERGDIARKHFEIDCRGERQEPINEQVKRVRHSTLAFGVQVESRAERGRPQHGVAALQRLLIEKTHRYVEVAQIAEREDAPEREGQDQRTEEDDQGGRQGPAILKHAAILRVLRRSRPGRRQSEAQGWAA